MKVIENFQLLLITIFCLVRSWIDTIIDNLFELYYAPKREYLPPITDYLITESALSLAQKIRANSISSEKIVQTFINRIKEVNGIVNAVIDNRFDIAIAEARTIDANIKAGLITSKDLDEKPLLGIPFTTKGTTSCKGLLSTYGLMSRKNKIATEDAEVVNLMKKAGAILVGSTNIPQLSMWQETSNPIDGRTNNPYNTTRTVGGSSGGDCATVAAGGVPIAIGTDIGGSIRIPAFMCGLFGHKPTNGLISTRGLTARTGLEKNTMVTAGPITKTVDDLECVLRVLVDKNVSKLKLGKRVDIKNINIYYALESGDLSLTPLTKEMKNAILKVIKHFEENTVTTPQQIKVKNLKFGGHLWRYWLRQEEGPTLARKLTNNTGEANFFVEFFKWIVRRSDYNIGTLLGMLNEIVPVMNKNWAEETTKELISELTSKLGNNGILIFPSAPHSAGHHNIAVLRSWNMHYFSIWNALKFPVTQVPIGLDSQGLPLGLQIVAAPYQDHLCLAIAKDLEKVFGGYIPPFDV